MAISNENYRNFVLQLVDDHERLVIQHRMFKNNFLQTIDKILSDYSLEEQLKIAKAKGRKLKILDFCCGEGMYLFDLAEMLEKLNLLEAAEYNGLDINQEAIINAEDFKKVAQPPRPYLRFYLYDAQQPLEKCPGLLAKGQKFDFIFGITALMYFPNPAQQIERLYELLNPGGIIYFRDYVIEDVVNMNYSLSELYQLFVNMIKHFHNNVDMAKASAQWLAEVGAEKILVLETKTMSGGYTKEGMELLRDAVMLLRNVKMPLVGAGFITAEKYDILLERVFQEVGPHMEGIVTFLDTIAQKPF